MRALFGIVGLLAVVLVVGMLAKKQLGAGGSPTGEGGTPPPAPKQQLQQFQQAVEGAVQQPRAMPDDVK